MILHYFFRRMDGLFISSGWPLTRYLSFYSMLVLLLLFVALLVPGKVFRYLMNRLQMKKHMTRSVEYFDRMVLKNKIKISVE